MVVNRFRWIDMMRYNQRERDLAGRGPTRFKARPNGENPHGFPCSGFIVAFPLLSHDKCDYKTPFPRKQESSRRSFRI